MEIPVFGLLYIFRGLTGGCKIWYIGRESMMRLKSMKSVKNQVWEQVGVLANDQIRNRVRYEVWFQANNQVWRVELMVRSGIW